METSDTTLTAIDADFYEEPLEPVTFEFTPGADAGGVSRRTFVQTLGAGLLIAVTCGSSFAQERRGPGGGRRGGGGGGFRGNGAKNVAARVHIAKDGAITVMTGKVEGGQGARAELTQAAAEELRVAPEKLRLIMADTELTPDDGVTAGSRSTPSSVPAVRQGCAAARNLLADLAAQRWGVDRAKLDVRDGKVTDAAGGNRSLAYADLAAADDAAALFAKPVPQDVALASAAEWRVLGTSVPRPNGRDVVTGAHQFPSDVQRPGMLYGKVLRPPSYKATLESVDLAPAREMKGVAAVQDGTFVAVAATTTFAADEALAAVADKAKWKPAEHPSSDELFAYLRKHAKDFPPNPFAGDSAAGAKSLKQTYHVPYVQHAPMEPRAAVAEWQDGKLTVWTATQNPFGVRGELVRAFGLADDKVRVIVPDFGGGFGGKHTGECAVEAARLAKAAGKPVSLRWTREEEFTWAYFRPAGVIEAEAGLDADGKLASWYFVNVNSGPSAIETPYRVPRDKTKTQFVQSEPPLRHGSYRALASTANVFARECFMDELAEAAGKDPLAFRLAHLDAGRLRDVLEVAATQFDFTTRFGRKEPGVGVGLACGTEKSSFVAACAEVAVDREKDTISVRRICQAYECGAIMNPHNLRKQVEGAILMGLGPALREEMRFEGGKVQNAAFSRYAVPRFADVPELDIHLLNRPDQPTAGAGETPLIAAAPAIANAVYHATGVRVRQIPIRLPRTETKV